MRVVSLSRTFAVRLKIRLNFVDARNVPYQAIRQKILLRLATHRDILKTVCIL